MLACDNTVTCRRNSPAVFSVLSGTDTHTHTGHAGLYGKTFRVVVAVYMDVCGLLKGKNCVFIYPSVIYPVFSRTSSLPST